MLSKVSGLSLLRSSYSNVIKLHSIPVDLIDGSGEGLGALDFFDPIDTLTVELIEKWWCLGTSVNRTAVWVQGQRIH